MRGTRKIVSLAVIGFVAFAALSCCCTQAVAKTFVASQEDHGCCPKEAKADPASHEQCAQCQHQLSQALQVHSDTYVSNILEKSNPLYVATGHFAAVAFSLSALPVALNGPPQGEQIPLYLQSHKLRL